MLAWSWEKWPDPTVDFGTQLYLPWRIVEGEVLYRDLAYFKGPLSPYLNALIFATLGVSIRALAIVNLAVLAGVLVMLARLLAPITDRATATVCLLTVVLIFSFLQLWHIGNYNWVTPYEHAYTHGIALSLGAMLAVRAFARSGRVVYAALAGALTGVAFLTTAEVFAACLAATVVGLAGTIWVDRRPAGQVARVSLEFVGAMLLPPLVAFALLSTAMPTGQALTGTLGSWPWVFDRRIGDLGFYRAGMGLDDPAMRLTRIGQILLGYTVVFGPAAVAAFVLPKRGIRFHARRAWAALAVSIAVGAGVGWVLLRKVPWFELALPLPLFLIALLVAAAVVLWRASGRADAESHARARRAVVRLMLTVFALALLGKMLLYARVQHYGFTLALPAGVLLIEALFGWVPRFLDRRGAAGALFRCTAGVAWGAYVVGMLYGFHLFTADKTVRVGAGGDRFLASARGAELNAALDAIARRSDPDQTLANLPQGLMVNYLARRAHPNRYLNFMPPEVISAGEQAIVDAYAADPPDLVLLAGVNVRDGQFLLLDGDHAYGGALYAWLRQNYVLAEEIRNPLPGTPTVQQWVLLQPRRRETPGMTTAPAR